MIIDLDCSRTHLIQKIVDPTGEVTIRYQAVPFGPDHNLIHDATQIRVFRTLVEARDAVGLRTIDESRAPTNVTELKPARKRKTA